MNRCAAVRLAIRMDDFAKHLDKLKKNGDAARLRIVAPRENEGDSKHHILIRQVAIPQKEVAMRLEPRCYHCDSEDPKIISLRNPALERYCGRFCLDKGHENFIRWIWRRMRRSRHDQLLRKFGMQAPVRASPA